MNAIDIEQEFKNMFPITTDLVCISPDKISAALDKIHYLRVSLNAALEKISTIEKSSLEYKNSITQLNSQVEYFQDLFHRAYKLAVGHSFDPEAFESYEEALEAYETRV